MKKNIYFEDLDGLRGLASILVMLYHFALRFILGKEEYQILFNVLSVQQKGGVLAVDFFFVLSGFLITYLLFTEQHKTGKINVLQFYLRRVLRIWPLYFLTLFLGFEIFPLFKGWEGVEIVEPASGILYALFLANFDVIHNAAPAIGVLGVHWSVSVEEQFYLIWPLLFLLILLIKKNFLPYVLIAMFIFSEIFIYLNGANFSFTYFHSISCIRFLAIGCLIGYFSYFNLEQIKKILSHIPKHLVLSIYLLFVFIVFFDSLFLEIFLWPNIRSSFFIFFFSFVILEQCFGENSFYKMRNFALLTWLGKRSYGLYLLHMVALYILLEFLPDSPSSPVFVIFLAVLLSVLLSALSYKYFEAPFLALKDKLAKSKTLQ